MTHCSTNGMDRRVIYSCSARLMFALDAETAHRATIRALRPDAAARAAAISPPSLASDVAGLRFPSPVGLAAGFDKDGEVPDAMLGLGFGFVEVGTLTPRPQAGNPRPRLFRLAEDQAVINRMGFNNRGQGAALARLGQARRAAGSSGSTSAPTRTAPTASPIMSRGSRRWRRWPTISTVNISSPNTPGPAQSAGRRRAGRTARRDRRGARRRAARRCS